MSTPRYAVSFMAGAGSVLLWQFLKKKSDKAREEKEIREAQKPVDDFTDPDIAKDTYRKNLREAQNRGSYGLLMMIDQCLEDYTRQEADYLPYGEGAYKYFSIVPVGDGFQYSSRLSGFSVLVKRNELGWFVSVRQDQPTLPSRETWTGDDVLREWRVPLFFEVGRDYRELTDFVCDLMIGGRSALFHLRKHGIADYKYMEPKTHHFDVQPNRRKTSRRAIRRI